MLAMFLRNILNINSVIIIPRTELPFLAEEFPLESAISERHELYQVSAADRGRQTRLNQQAFGSLRAGLMRTAVGQYHVTDCSAYPRGGDDHVSFHTIIRYLANESYIEHFKTVPLITARAKRLEDCIPHGLIQRRISNPQSVEMSSTSSVVLNTGVSMPLVGFGTYNLCESGEVYIAVDAALQAGYRAFDTAAVYGNEAELGRALRELLPKHGLSREDIFITSKLGPKDQGERAMEAALHSVSELGMDYIDLYLIHWPGTRDLAVGDPCNQGNRAGSWVALEELHAQGKLRAIGVSNYTPVHMKTLLQSCRTPPALLQTEFHPRLCQTDLRRVCEEQGVCFQAYSSLGKGELVKHPVVMEVAKGCERTPAQVLLRWAVQQGVPVLPKSSNPTRIQENMALFDFSLDTAAMERLTALDDKHKYCRDSSEVV